VNEIQQQFIPCRKCTCSALRRASRALTRHFEKQFRGAGLRATQFTILATLIQTDAIAISRLAKLLGVERTTLTRNLGPLEKRKLVQLTGDSDGRVRQVAITGAGLALARKTLPRWKNAQAGATAVLQQFDVKVGT